MHLVICVAVIWHKIGRVLPMTLGYESYIIVIVEKYNLKNFKERRGDFGIKQLGCTLNRMEREEETAQIFKEILRIVSNEYNNGNFPHTNSTPLNSEKEFVYMKATGIVRRIEECVIIGQKSKKSYKH